MQPVCHVYAFPPVRLERPVNDITHLRHGSNCLENVRELHPLPLGDIRPSFFTRDFRDVTMRRETLQLFHRERLRTCCQAIHREPPVREASCLKALEFIAKGSDLVSEWLLGDFAAIEFPSERVRGDHAVRSVREGFSRAPYATRVRGNESILSSQLRCDDRAC